MLIWLTFSLLCLAIVLQMAHNAPEVDEHEQPIRKEPDRGNLDTKPRTTL
jgi:hypothetical protein